MNYKVENINDCTKKLFFDFEKVDLSDQIGNALKKKQATASLKGFRKGKAPLSMIQKLYGPQVENEAIYQFVSKEFFNAMKTEGINPIGYPQFSNTEYKKDDQSIKFQATVEIVPEIILNDFSSYTFERQDDKVVDEDIEDEKKKHLNAKAVIESVEDKTREIKEGDFVILNFQGEMKDGSKPENMKGEEYQLEVGGKQFIPGFEEGLVGLKVGDKESLKLTFPENYHQEDLKSAPVTFHTEILEIKEKKLPEFTDEFVKEMKFDSVADFETKTKERLENQKKREADEKLHQEMLEKFVKENDFEVPTLLIENQKQNLRKDLEQNFKQSGFNDKMIDEYFDKWAGDLTEKANFQVRSGLILESLAKKYSIESSESDLKPKFEEMAKQAGMKVEEVEKIYGENAQVKSNLLYAIKEEKTFEKLKEEVTVKQL